MLANLFGLLLLVVFANAAPSGKIIGRIEGGTFSLTPLDGDKYLLKTTRNGIAKEEIVTQTNPEVFRVRCYTVESIPYGSFIITYDQSLKVYNASFYCEKTEFPSGRGGGTLSGGCLKCTTG
ncbi:uncharacterized protein Dvir_GJ26313 [Drosophila virilis]|uniref:Uncharacterized protein n=1 Tax=Drosophila virilis TaxID=7244 RepID=A0A0Q9WTN4_DROVI|nr:uncharacterized protein LOC26531083 [Drosophila virilis]KRF84228.1 uncharacterized protein Dvir_GJ26313 [Drosophila virilis]